MRRLFSWAARTYAAVQRGGGGGLRKGGRKKKEKDVCFGFGFGFLSSFFFTRRRGNGSIRSAVLCSNGTWDIHGGGILCEAYCNNTSEQQEALHFLSFRRVMPSYG